MLFGDENRSLLRKNVNTQACAHTHTLARTHAQLEDKMKVQCLCCNHTEVNGDYNYHKEKILLEQLLWVRGGGVENVC